MSLLGIDVGTSAAKAVLFSETGAIEAAAYRTLALRHPRPGHAEQDADEVMAAVHAAVAEVIAVGGAPSLTAVTGQGDGCWLVDGAGRPVRPAVNWMDGRSADLMAGWRRDGTVERVFSYNGNTLFAGSMAAILAWLDDQEPRVLDRAVTAAYCKDVVFQRLTGLRATDRSDASLPFGDPRGDGYLSDALKTTGLDHRAPLLAPVLTPLPIGETGGGLLPRGALVTSGPFDLPACAIGSGLDRPGDGLLIVGTTLGCEVLVDRVDTSAPPAGMHIALPTPGRWMRVMAAMSGCASLDWVLAMVGLTHADLDGALHSTRPGASGVEMLPYLAPSGERAPFVDPHASGQIAGLRLTSTRADVVRATCEGLAYAARHCFEAAGLTGRLVVCGGGARSRPWLQIFASVLNRPVEVARGVEVGSRGAVMAALDALGSGLDHQEWTRPDQVVEPVAADVALYEEGYARFTRRRTAALD